MAGFFGFMDPNRDGPGVPKDAPPKPRIKVFFEVYFRKFWNLVILNIMYLVFNLPALIPGFFISWILLQRVNLASANDKLYISLVTAIFLTCMSIVTVGPVHAGFTYILRNYAREEHAFIWWDFKQAAKKNLKQSLIVSAVGIMLMLLLALDILFYYDPQRHGIAANILNTLVLLITFIFTIMHMYIYPMMVTFNLNVKQLYKNSLMLAMAKFLPNLLIATLCAMIVFLVLLFNIYVFIIFYLFIIFSLIGFITNFYVYPKLIKYVLDEQKPENEKREDN